MSVYFFVKFSFFSLAYFPILCYISDKYQFKYDLNSILSRLIYGRIIFPSSKLAVNELSKKFIEQPNFELQHIYRALDVISKENDFIQSELYKNSLKISKRNTGILYYDCTNYFFEIEEASGLRQYGPSKEHRPNPITQMGLFMDGDGIPLAFNITAGNTNEQGTLTPLEEKILKDFELSKFIVCTDAGLASNDNRKFNDKEDCYCQYKNKIFLYKIVHFCIDNNIRRLICLSFSKKCQIQDSIYFFPKLSIFTENILPKSYYLLLRLLI